MKETAFLIINRRGTMRINKNRPSLNNDEIALNLVVNIPQVFFDRLMPTAQIDVPEDAITSVNPDVAVNIAAQAISDALQLDVVEVRDGLKEMVLKKQDKEKNNAS